MKYIERKAYLDRLKGLKNTPDIKIITGIRRCGKSELMQAYMEFIRQSDLNANIIFVDFFDLDFDDLKNYKALHGYVNEKFIQGKNNYVFIDEVQLCSQFELAINSLHNSMKYDIYITGSNAFLLSSDLTTLFTGRFIEIPVYPFSFKEFCLYYSDTADKNELLDEYICKGGLAGSYVYQSEVDRAAYIRDVYNTIVKRDLVDKYNIRDLSPLAHLAEFLMDNISNLCSPDKICACLEANLYKTDIDMVNNYIKYLCNAYVFYNIKRYDIKGKRYLETSEKYYLNDLGVRFAVLGNKNSDYGRAYENIVAMELIRRGYEVYVGKLYQKEVDFVAIKQGKKLYIQVSDNITQEKTFLREVNPLLQIRDAYPKIILANTRHPEYQYEGIRVINIADWLLDN